ncbi:MAG: tungsten cofactor oxidoreductase radical SAM maturase [Armatimonadota bacterium]|nr:tungsten cofactor oxidoreductase radical SAM maturase [Armatimonadota bacterium]MDR5703343.1 tungsten cofactor oxidoreductase radical SAM maturase [Armatimonadota bacterium]
MGRLILGPEKTIRLPEGTQGSEVILEPLENGWSVWFARPDVRRVYIEPTTRCNLDCAMCVRRVWKDPVGEMGWETFQKVLEDLRSFPDLHRVTFGGFGEPLVHPRIVEMVAQVRDLGVGVTLTTNGVLLDRSMSEALLEAGLDTIVVSVDPMHVQAYARAGLMEGVDRVLTNVQGLRELARRRNLMVPRIGLEYVVTRSNLEELTLLPELAKALGASFVLVTNLLPHTQDLASDILYDRDEPLPLPAGWPVPSGDWIVWGIPKLPRLKWGAHRRCRFVEQRALVIAWDGVVSPCYHLLHSYPFYIYGRRKEVTRYVLGHVGERSLLEIWTSPEYVLFRAKVREFRFPSCVDCGMNCTFAQENADCWGNNPSCADCLWAQDMILCP